MGRHVYHQRPTPFAGAARGRARRVRRSGSGHGDRAGRGVRLATDPALPRREIDDLFPHCRPRPSTLSVADETRPDPGSGAGRRWTARVGVGVVVSLASIVLVGPWWASVMLGVGIAIVFDLARRSVWRTLLFVVALGIVQLVAGLLGVRVVAVPAAEGHWDSGIAVVVPQEGAACAGQIVAFEVCDSARRAAGLSVDRVVGVVGDRVLVADGRLTVNGREPDRVDGPLGLIPGQARMDRVLSAGEVAVIPSLVRWSPHGPDPDAAIAKTVARQAILSPSQIVGRVVVMREGGWRWRVCP